MSSTISTRLDEPQDLQDGSAGVARSEEVRRAWRRRSEVEVRQAGIDGDSGTRAVRPRDWRFSRDATSKEVPRGAG
jgi:hypothetical protein